MRAYATRAISSLILMGGALGCMPAHAAAGRNTPQAGALPGYTESGVATWYGPRHEGLRTTSGEVFDSRGMTAAHSSLPMGSWVRVTLEDGGRSIVVRVNDREPPHGIRCIDLSRAAADRLGIVQRGVADVRLAQISAAEAETEVAEAPDGEMPVDASSPRHSARVRHGRQHRHPARR